VVCAEEKVGNVAQLTRETDLRRGPSEDSPILGRLPAGTILSFKGERSGGFVLVEVELEDGTSLEGWVLKDALDKMSLGDDDEEQETFEQPESAPAPSRIKQEKPKKKKLRIPKDEGILLKREPSFAYGARAGGSYSLIDVDNGNRYTGLGLFGGAHAGMFVNEKFPIFLEANFFQANGTADDNLNLAFNFFELGVEPLYLITPYLEVFAGLSYAFGLGLADIPPTVQVAGAGDLSSFWVHIGGGYRVKVTPEMDMAFRLNYRVSFLRSPFLFQLITLLAVIEFRG